MFSIIGNGHWGIALGEFLSQRYAVELVGRRIKPLPNGIHLSQTTLESSLSYPNLIYAAPTKFATSILLDIVKSANPPKTIIIASKGLIEDESSCVMPLTTWLSQYCEQVAMISGPSFASELLEKKTTCLIGASKQPELCQVLVNWFNHKPILLKTSTDCLGVSLVGAFKNPVAILIGYLDSHVNSANMRFAVINYAHQVCMSLLMKIGADEQTAHGVAGQGDLFMTCSMDHSRNRQMGQLLAKGHSAKVAEDMVGSMVEGIYSLRCLIKYCRQEKLSVPLLNLINAMLEGQVTFEDIMSKLEYLMMQSINDNVENFVV